MTEHTPEKDALEASYLAPSFVDDQQVLPCPESGVPMYRDVALGLQVWLCSEVDPCGPCECPAEDDCYCPPPRLNVSTRPEQVSP